MNLIRPLHGNFPITQTFQEHVERKEREHLKYYNGGIDYAAPLGTPVYAAMDGYVSAVSDPNGYGTYIKETSGIFTAIYGHLSVNNLLPNNTLVKQGTLIGYTGNSGNSTGPHLHLELRKNNTPIDPEPLFVESVEPTPDDFVLPEVPKIPQASVLVPSLNIRQSPAGILSGLMAHQGDTIPILGSQTVNGNTWLNIGFQQWVAGYFNGEPYVKVV